VNKVNGFSISQKSDSNSTMRMLNLEIGGLVGVHGDNPDPDVGVFRNAKSI
jgi:hypothetical protein